MMNMKNEVGGSQTYPFGMAERCIDMSPRTGIIYHNHSGDGDTSQYIERKKPFIRRVVHGIYFLRLYIYPLNRR